MASSLSEFLTLEARRWKGRAGTAIDSDPAIGGFVNSVVAMMAAAALWRASTVCCSREERGRPRSPGNAATRPGSGGSPLTSLGAPLSRRAADNGRHRRAPPGGDAGGFLRHRTPPDDRSCLARTPRAARPSHCVRSRRHAGVSGRAAVRGLAIPWSGRRKAATQADSRASRRQTSASQGFGRGRRSARRLAQQARGSSRCRSKAVMRVWLLSCTAYDAASLALCWNQRLDCRTRPDTSSSALAAGRGFPRGHLLFVGLLRRSGGPRSLALRLGPSPGTAPPPLGSEKCGRSFS